VPESVATCRFPSSSASICEKLCIFQCKFCDCACRMSRIVSPSTKPTIIFVFLQKITATGTSDVYKLLSRIVLQRRFITFRVKAMPADKWLGLTDTLWCAKNRIVLTITRWTSRIQTQSEMYYFGWNMSKRRPDGFRKYCPLTFLSASFEDADRC
jgi:hypothetical protein